MCPPSSQVISSTVASVVNTYIYSVGTAPLSSLLSVNLMCISLWQPPVLLLPLFFWGCFCSHPAPFVQGWRSNTTVCFLELGCCWLPGMTRRHMQSAALPSRSSSASTTRSVPSLQLSGDLTSPPHPQCSDKRRTRGRSIP